LTDIIWMPAKFLTQYNMVIYSHIDISSQYKKAINIKMHWSLAYTRRLDIADAMLGTITEFPYLPLHSRLYKQEGKIISTLILNKSHIAKKEDTQLNVAIRSLRYGHAFSLSRTPIYNT